MIFFLILLFPLTIFANERDFLASEVELSNLIKCAQMPSLSEMRTEVEQIYREERGKLAGHRKRNNTYSSGANLNGMVVDGPLIRSEVSDLHKLTIHSDAFSWLWGDDYDITSRRKNNELHMTRTCNSIICKGRGFSEFDLSSFTGNAPCTDILCAYDKIFGTPQGTMIAWAYKKHGLKLSRYIDINGDDFSVDTMKAAITAQLLVPSHLQEDAAGDGFYRFKRGYSLKMYGDRPVVANAAGAVFDLIERESFNSRVGIFIHEMGHRCSYAEHWLTGYWNKSDSKEWLEASGWQKNALGEFESDHEGAVSRYAKTNPAEDFAETFLLYRANPRRLMQLSPSRYAYMRDEVFDEIEYTADLCGGSRNPQFNSTPSADETTEAIQ